MATATQSPLLASVPAQRAADIINLPDRAKQLRARRHAAVTAARDPQIAEDLRDTADQAAADIAANPRQMRAILRQLALGCYAHGRLDQVDADAPGIAQSDVLAKATVTQLDRLITGRQNGAGAS